MSEELEEQTQGPDRSPLKSRRLRWKWADGQYHSEPPPSLEQMPVPKGVDWNGLPTPETSPPQLPLEPPQNKGSGARVEELARVPADFVHTPRSLLRAQALDFVLRAAALLPAHKQVTGAELMNEAEALERWLAEPALKGTRDDAKK